MFILALGHRYNMSVPHKNNILKRSSGWVSYVVLAIDGIVSILLGLIALSVIIVITFLVLLLLKLGISWHLNEIYDLLQNLLSLSYNDYIRTGAFILGVIFAYIANEIRLRNNTFLTDYEQLKSLDGVLKIIIHAMETGSYIKVSLKSGKVYIRAVLGEQFEHDDLDNITILPMESGYRTKETLHLILDCDYKSVYLNHGVIEMIDCGLRYYVERAEDMMMVIRVNQIESLSLFDANIYKDFQYKGKPDSFILD